MDTAFNPPTAAQLRSRLRRAAATLHTLADHVSDELDPALRESLGSLVNDYLDDDLRDVAAHLGAEAVLGLVQVDLPPPARPAVTSDEAPGVA